jgi:outer membrane biogenesis lipoprotein LolB
VRYLLLLVVLLFAACSPPQSSPAPKPPTIEVRIQNQRWDDVMIYALDGGASHRLGRVSALSRVRWRVRYPASGRLAIGVDVFASREAFVLGPEPVRPGDVVEVRLQGHAPLSTLSIAE